MNRDVARKHLDRRLTRLKPVAELEPPPRGWIRAIRDALGMTAEQLGRRLDVSKQGVQGMETAEERRAVTLATLARVAEAMDCTLVYALVPNQSLEETVRRRAYEVASAQLARVHHTMQLEAQGVDDQDWEDERDVLAGELARTKVRRLWDTS